MDTLYINGQETAYARAARLNDDANNSEARVLAIHAAAKSGTLLQSRYIPKNRLWKTTSYKTQLQDSEEYSRLAA